MSSRRWQGVVLSVLLVLFLALLAADAAVLLRRIRYTREIARLRESMSVLERERASEIMAREQDELRLALALLRWQARREPELHLAVSIDSGAMFLERDGTLLREMPIHIGAERKVGSAPDTVRMAIPRGARTLARVLTGEEDWEVPAWVYSDRALPTPANRSIRGGLGPVALLMDGGTIIYSLPQEGPLRDSAYVMPGALRARVEDLTAILPNLKPGVRVYLY